MVKTTLRTMVQLDFCHLTALLLLCYSRHSDSFKNIQTAVFSGKDGPQMVLRPSAKLLNIAEGGGNRQPWREDLALRNGCTSAGVKCGSG